MERNKKQNRRMIITVALVLAAAFTGLFVINVDRVDADKSTAANTLSQAADNDRNVESDEKSLYNGGSLALSTFRMISALVVVLVCIYLGVYLLKKLMGRRKIGSGRDNLLQVLETTYVGPKKTVSLVRVADRSVLIGVTDNQISILTELNAEETSAITDATDENESEGFNRLLKTACDRVKKLHLKRNRAVLEN
ncbi:MAG: flagellar biosynthetic protein FliO [candidate division Zixibacteria bacterium]|nr:flagellar biosynthetic protein FliO [candidate division Zixibacteria bacterium]